MNIKDYVRKRLEEYKKQTKIRKGYESILKEKIAVAKRQAYAKESIKQARLRAKEQAKVRFAKQKPPSLFIDPISKPKIPKQMGAVKKIVEKRTLIVGNKEYELKDKIKKDLIKKETKLPKKDTFDNLFWKY